MAAGAWKLIIEDDAGKQIVVPFTRDVITIGRKEGNTIRLTERNVSRNHAKLSKDNGHVVIEDLGSFNGIKLNGDRIDGRVLVHEGDTIQIGDYHLALHAQDGARANGQGQGQQPAPQPRSQAANAPTADDDEFAGDTQRWEPPQGMQGISVQTLPTQEDRAVRSDELTEKAPQSRSQAHVAATVETAPVRLTGGGGGGGGGGSSAAGGGFSADNGDTERVSLDMLQSLDPLGLDSMKSGAPSRAVREEPDLEPTVRQAASPAPVSTPGGAIQPLAQAQAQAQAQGGAQALHDHRADARNDRADRDLASTRPERSAPSHAHSEPHQPPREVRSSGQHAQLPNTPAAPPRTPSPASVADARQVLEEQTEAVRPSPGAADETLPRLVVLNTIFAGSSFPLRTAEAVIGRTEDNDITIEHKSVSRNHAKIVREGDRVRILDLKSANGVLVNNEEVEQAVLRSGDVVELGRVRMRFVPIGERFHVPPDEIERARIADRAGDDFENDSGTGVTNPVRKKQASQQFGAPSGSYDTIEPPKNRAPIYLALGGVIGLIIVVALFFALSGDKEEPKEPIIVGATDPLDAIPKVDPPPKDGDASDGQGDSNGNANANANADTDGAAATDNADGSAASAAGNDDKIDGADDVEAKDGDDVRRPPKRVRDRDRDDVKRRKAVDVDKNLADAGKALIIGKFEDAVRLSKDVLGEPSASDEERKRARHNIKTACEKTPAPKGCPK